MLTLALPRTLTLAPTLPLTPTPNPNQERAGMRLLADYIETTLKELRRYQGKLPPPEEADMPAIKEPDNTDDAKDDW